MKQFITAALALGLGLCASPAAANAAEEWAVLTSSPRTTYLVDLGGVRRESDTAAVRVAGVPNDPTRDKDGYQIQTLEFRCEAGQSRIPLTIDYSADGSEFGKYEDASAAWDAISEDSLEAQTKEVACDAVRPPGQTWPTVQTFMANGRG